MISLTEENRVTVQIGGLRVTCVFPSFSELLPDIRAFVGRPMIFSAQGKMQDNGDEKLLALFDARCKRVEGVRARGADGTVADVTDMAACLKAVPESAKVKAAATVFGIPGGADFRPTEALGDPTVVVLPVMGDEVAFVFPPMDDPAFQDALKSLLSDHSQALGGAIQFNTHAARMKFYKENCQAATGIGMGAKGDVPESWAAGACMAFQRQETLAGQALGN